jgi:plastocyanin
MRKTLFALVAVLALAGAACSSDSSTPSDGGSSSGGGACAADTATATESITAAGFAFDPNCLTVATGGTISLSNGDTTTHSFTLDDAAADVSVDIPAGGSAEATAPAAGTYGFHCRFHSSMTGTLIVT